MDTEKEQTILGVVVKARRNADQYVSDVSVWVNKECDEPTTEQECRTAVTAKSLQEGGGGYAFAGSYAASKGCYAYSGGTWGGKAFWSTKSDAPVIKAFSPEMVASGQVYRVCKAGQSWVHAGNYSTTSIRNNENRVMFVTPIVGAILLPYSRV